MTNLSDAMASALSTISSFDGITLEYRAGESGGWTTLTGFVVHKDRVPQLQYDERGGVEVQGHTGYIKGPTTPALAQGYQVRVGSANTDIWSVQSVMVKGQQIALLRRNPVKTLTPDRGATR